MLAEARPDGLGLAVLVRGDLPVRAAPLPSPLPGPCQAPAAAVRVEIAGRPLALLGVHAPPPGAPCGHRNVPTPGALARWMADGRLRADHGPCRAGDPVVLLGDLDALPRSISLAPLADAGLRDAWPAVRDGPGPTWAPLLTASPVLRIDAV